MHEAADVRAAGAADRTVGRSASAHNESSRLRTS